MIARPTRHRMGRIAFGIRCLPGLLALAALSFLACDGGDVGTSPSQGDLIFGELSAVDTPLLGTVFLESVNVSGDADQSLSMRMNADGSYEFEVPEGDYALRADFAQEEFWGRITYPVGQTPETLSVEPGGAPIQADFRFGRGTIGLTVPEDSEGSQSYLTLYSAATEFDASRSRRYSSEAMVTGGVAEYSYRIIPADSYIAKANVQIRQGTTESPGDYWQYFWLSQADIFGQADSITVGLDALFSEEFAVSGPPARLTGFFESGVMELTGHEPGIELYLVDGDSMTIAKSRRLPQTGEFDIPLYEPVPFRIKMLGLGACRDCPDAGSWVGGESFESATVFSADAGEVITDIRLRDRCLSVELIPPAGWPENEPLEAGVALVGTDGRTLSSIGIGGRKCYLNGLGPGEYFLHVYPFQNVAWASQWYGGASSIDEATPIVVTEDDLVIEKEIQLEEGGRLRGHVLDEISGLGIDVHVYVIYVGDPYAWRIVRSEADTGEFEFLGLVDGGYQIYAQGIWYPDSESQDGGEILIIENQGVIEGIEFLIP